MPDEERKPVARPVFRILAGGLAVACFLFAALFLFLPNMGDVGLLPYIFIGEGVIIAGLALTGNAAWWGRRGTGGA
jgi:hypothetical protein